MRGLRNIGELGCPLPGRNALESKTDHCVLVENGLIQWTGPEADVSEYLLGRAVEWFDVGGNAVMPGLVESHSHLVYAGNRSGEFRERCAGRTYEEIAAAGGGIRATATAVRNSSVEELVQASLPRLMRMLSFGVTTVEIKSGYGLSLEAEIKMLRAIQELRKRTSQRLVATFLGAHSVPPEYKGRSDAYVDRVVNEMLPRVAEEGLASFCDVFCERGAFTVSQAERILMAASDLGLLLKLHAEQLSRTGATALGVALGAASVDHCEFINDEDLRLLQGSGQTVAAILPGATLFLGMSDWAPARKLLDAGVPVALSTDCNPGSSNTENLQLMANLGCTRLGMTVEESLASVTSVASKALALETRVGAMESGMAADLIVLNSPRLEDMVYSFGSNRVGKIMIAGEWVHN